MESCKCDGRGRGNGTLVVSCLHLEVLAGLMAGASAAGRGGEVRVAVAAAGTSVAKLNMSPNSKGFCWAFPFSSQFQKPGGGKKRLRSPFLLWGLWAARWGERQGDDLRHSVCFAVKYPAGEPARCQACFCGKGTQPLFCTARPPCLLFFTPPPHQREPGPTTSGTPEPAGCTQELCREPSGVCSWTRGAGTPATAGGGHRGAALPRGLTHEGLWISWFGCQQEKCS